MNAKRIGNTRHARRRQQGLSLVELMIAMAIGAALIGGIIQIFTSNNQAFRTQKTVARMQENARFGFHFLGKELREAGYSGCAGKAQNKNVLDTSDDTYNYMFDFTKSVEGYDFDGDMSSMPPVIQNLDPAPKADTDIVVVRRAGEDEVAAAEKQPNKNAANLKAEEETAFNQGDILTISDCQSSWTFQVTQVKNSNTTVVINKGNKTSPGNKQKVTQDDLGPDFSISKAMGTIFYISDENGEPALWRKVNDQDPRELVSGIEDMHIEYAMDDDIKFVDKTDPDCNIDKPGGEGDGAVDAFRSATDVNSIDCGWAEVIGAKLSLLIRSESDRLRPNGQTFQWEGSSTTRNDGRLRHVVNSTFTFRNKTR